MNTIYFKNGMTKQVSQEVAQTLNKRLLEGCGQFQMFTKTDGTLFFIVNMFEIVYID